MFTFDVIAGLASVLGLIFSVCAFMQARIASRAAKEARDAIIVRTLADEFQLACRNTDELLDLVKHDRFPEAARVAHELTSTLSEIPHRRSSYLTVERKNELLNIRTQMQIVEQEISALRPQAPSAKQKQGILRVCRESSATLRENLGTIKGQLEGGGNS
jgi:hypothetical protein